VPGKDDGGLEAENVVEVATTPSLRDKPTIREIGRCPTDPELKHLLDLARDLPLPQLHRKSVHGRSAILGLTSQDGEAQINDLDGKAAKFIRCAMNLITRCVDVDAGQLWFSSIALNHNTISDKHRDVYNEGDSILLLLGEFEEASSSTTRPQSPRVGSC